MTISRFSRKLRVNILAKIFTVEIEAHILRDQSKAKSAREIISFISSIIHVWSFVDRSLGLVTVNDQHSAGHYIWLLLHHTTQALGSGTPSASMLCSKLTTQIRELIFEIFGPHLPLPFIPFPFSSSKSYQQIEIQ